MLNAFSTLCLWVASRSERDEGATAVEYGIMVAFIAIGIIAAVTGVRDALITLFGNVAAAL